MFLLNADKGFWSVLIAWVKRWDYIKCIVLRFTADRKSNRFTQTLSHPGVTQFLCIIGTICKLFDPGTDRDSYSSYTTSYLFRVKLYASHKLTVNVYVYMLHIHMSNSKWQGKMSVYEWKTTSTDKINIKDIVTQWLRRVSINWTFPSAYNGSYTLFLNCSSLWSLFVVLCF